MGAGLTQVAPDDNQPNSVDAQGVHPRLASKDVPFALYYPMWLMPLQLAMSLHSLRPHQELKEDGQLVQFKVGMISIFISHQWLAVVHPDPEMRQFRVLQGALRNILAGTLKLQGDAGYSTVYKRLLQISDERLQELRGAHLWYDWFCCPQISARSATQNVSKELQAAVDSIPAYVHLSDYFVILAPPVSTPSGKHCNYHTLRTRGWCRLEMFAWVFTEDKPPMIQVTGVHTAVFTSAIGWLDDTPGTGAFALESDREKIRPVLEGMLAWKLKRLRAKQDLHDWRFFCAMRGHVLKGLAAPPRFDGAHDLVSELGFQGPVETCRGGDGAGWTTLHYAAIAGGEPLEQLVALRADLNSRITNGYPTGMVVSGTPPLMLAALLGPSSSVRALLRLRADPCAADDLGGTALMGVVRRRDVEVALIKDVLQARADINQTTTWPLSYNALSTAAAVSSPEAVAALVDLRADLSPIGLTGNALTSAVMGNTAQVVEVLLDKRMDPNFRWDTRWSGRWLICAVARGAVHMGAGRGIFEILALSDGATPLLYAAMAGNAETVHLLLAARATADARCSNGQSALDLAEEHRHDDVRRLLEEHCGGATISAGRGPPPWVCGACAADEGDDGGLDGAAALPRQRANGCEVEESLELGKAWAVAPVAVISSSDQEDARRAEAGNGLPAKGRCVASL